MKYVPGPAGDASSIRREFAGSRFCRCLAAAAFLVCIASHAVLMQARAGDGLPSAERMRPHTRVPRSEPAGERFVLSELKGAVLYVSPQVRRDRAAPILIHFHGASWLIESHIAAAAPKTALLTVNLGAGSRAYGGPFEDAGLFQRILDEAARLAGVKRGWGRISLSGWSAGYGAVRAILRHEESFQKVAAVLLLDGMHASYSPEGKVLAEGGSIKADDLDSFVRFAREAAAGRKKFVFTHSEIFPGTYASTSECGAFVLGSVGLKSEAKLKTAPLGMQQTRFASSRGLTAFGFTGTTAADHIDHIHAMSAWFKRLGLR